MENGRFLSTLSLFAIRDGGPVWRDALRRLVDGLIDLAVDDGHGAYFWPSPLYAYKDRPPRPSPREPIATMLKARALPMGWYMPTG